MSSKPIKKWITINGNHVPVYEDGSLGGVGRNFMANDGTSRTSHAEKASGKTIDSLAEDLKDNYGLELDSADKHSMSGSMNDEKVTMYDKEGNEYEGTYNRYSDGEREIVNIKKKEAEDWTEKGPMSLEEHEEKYGDKEKSVKEKDAEAYMNAQDKLSKEGNEAAAERKQEARQAANAANSLASMSDEQLKETAKNTLASGNAEATFALSQEAARRGWKSLNGPDNKETNFSAKDAAASINEISSQHNNRGGDTENDWKQVRDTLEAAPVGTTMIQTGDRGAKYQFTKGEDGKWHGSYDTDSKALSMGWVGQGHRPTVEFTTPDNALTDEQLKDTQIAAVNGALDQRLGLSKSGNPITRADMAGTGISSSKSVKIGDKEVGVSKTKPTPSELYDKANAAYKKSEARSQKTELARAKESGDYSGISASTYLKMPISEIRSIGRQLGLSDFALSGNKSEIIADILWVKRKK